MRLTLESEVFNRGVEDVVTKEELGKLLAQKKQMRIKHGIDATAPDLHLGHLANLWKIRALQEEGHKAVVLLGDVTTKVGDPTGRSKARPVLGNAEVSKNTKAIEKIVKSVLISSPRVFELHKSSEWYGKMRVEEFLKLASMITHARIIERDMFRKRIKERSEIFVHELLYPILQGYDSVALKSDLTVIGSDQLFNEHVGRFFQEKFNQKPQVIVSLKIIPGLDGGPKMSKSLGNYIGWSDSPQEKFGKAMRTIDPLIIEYLEVYTDVPVEKVSFWKNQLDEGENPMKAKLFFAEELVRRYHGEKTARAEREKFSKIFSKKDFSGIEPVSLKPGDYHVLDLLQKLGFITSRSDGRRLIEHRAVEINGKVIDTIGTVYINEGDLIKVGKKKFARVKKIPQK